MTTPKNFILLAFLFLPFTFSFAQKWATPEVEKRVNELISQMDLETEKLPLTGGAAWMNTFGIERLHIPQLNTADGPQGIGANGNAPAYPAGILLAATWNREIAYKYGHSLANDAKARGIHILLGPGVNIYRAPMCGRNFEYFGEDPLLAAQTTVNYIKGVQENGVMATVKHFVANNQEYARNKVSSDVDERTLNEIYFPAFKAAVQEAEVGAVMSSYNPLNGEYTVTDKWLLIDVLRKQWGFKGVHMSDWRSAEFSACEDLAKNGLDLDMPGREFMTVDCLKRMLAENKISEETINEKVRNFLRPMIGMGFYDKGKNGQLDKSIPSDNPQSNQTALEVAREGIVLLKNTDNILPVNTKKVRTIAVVGQNATRFLCGGGSGKTSPFHTISMLGGIRSIATQYNINVKFVEEYSHMHNELFIEKGSKTAGLKGEYFDNPDLKGKPAATQIDPYIDYDWKAVPNVPTSRRENFSVRWTGVFRTPNAGIYEFTIGGDDGYRLYIDDELICDEWKEGGFRTRSRKKTIKANTDYKIQIDYLQKGGEAYIEFTNKKTDANYFVDQLNASDLVIACFGYNSKNEGEGADRPFELPETEQKLINEVCKTKTPVVGIVTVGGNVEMQSWEPKLKGLLWAWYPGQEGGTAIAEILFGKINPSGKLPVTFEKRWADNPVYNSYYDSDGDKHVKYTEGIFVGYRGYDKLKREVQYPFGFGLSYSTFELNDLKISGKNTDITISCTLKNTSKKAGAQVVQLYAGKRGGSTIERPLQELKGFEKVYLKPGESKVVTIKLNKDAFSYYNINKKDFEVDPGEYEIVLGFSSRDKKLSENILITR